MADLTALPAPTWIDSVRGWFAPRATRAAPDGTDDAKAALLDAVRNGYVVEATGERATLPGLARAQLETAIRYGDA